jgi:hypothetical protein
VFAAGVSVSDAALTVDLRLGDCLDILPILDACSVDAIVTDPPYGLEFMGRDWDGQVPGVPYWAQCLRVLRPGGHLLAFGGTRTWHRLAVAIEDAGFEIRDTITWLYGSGFPKSLDVSKAIDKRGGTDGSWFAEWLSDARAAAGFTLDEVSAHFPSKTGGKTGKIWNWEHGHGVCTQDEFDRLCEILDQPRLSVFEAEGKFIAARRGRHGRFGPDDTRGNGPRRPITAPATPEAQQWQGWGTALKPASEPVIVARKPLSGTVAGNVLAYGTGALNIDATRVGTEVRTNNAGGTSSLQRVSRVEHGYRDHVTTSMNEATTVTGRWPANVVLSHSEQCVDECALGECPVAELDAQSGNRPGGHFLGIQRTMPGQANGTMGGGWSGEIRPARAMGDDGGASRFFPTFRYTGTEQSCALSSMLTGCERVPIAAMQSQPTGPLPVTVPSPVPAMRSPRNAAKPEPSTSSASTADRSGRTTPATTGGTAPEAVPTRSSAPSDLHALYAASLCGSCATAIARSAAATRHGHSVSQALGLPSMGDFSESILTRSLALFAADLESSGTTSTTTASMTSLGCVVDAISTYITRTSLLPKRRSEESGPGRLADAPPMKYQAKAPTWERPKIDGKGWPTVKPLGLMRWLVRLVTPPGGLVLDPFAGTGATLQAAHDEGFRALGIERDEFAYRLALQRLGQPH